MELLQQNTANLPQFSFQTDVPATALVFKDASDIRATDGKKRVRLTASTSATDLVGDVMSNNALVRMKSAAAGTTVFLNHETKIPYDVFGSVEKAELISRKMRVVDESGSEILVDVLCLDYDVVVEESNKPALDTYNIIAAGSTTLGASVTIAIVGKRILNDGRRQIDDVIYLETSIVGIPCNQTAWVQTAKGMVNEWVQFVKSSSWIHKSRKAANRLPGLQIEVESESSFDIASLSQSSGRTIPDASLSIGATTVSTSLITQKGAKAITALIIAAKTATEFIVAFKDLLLCKDLFTDEVEEHFENPWLYMDLLSYAFMELLWWNTSMPKDEKLAAASQALDAFKVKMLEVLDSYFTEDDAEKSASLKQAFFAAASKSLAAVMKAGARNNSDDKKSIQKIHDESQALGADCAVEDDTEKSIKIGEQTFSTKDIATLQSAIDSFVEAKTAEVIAPEDSPKIVELVEANEALDAEVKRLQASEHLLQAVIKSEKVETAKWKAKAEVAASLAEKALKMPAPRTGFATASVS